MLYPVQTQDFISNLTQLLLDTDGKIDFSVELTSEKTSLDILPTGKLLFSLNRKDAYQLREIDASRLFFKGVYHAYALGYIDEDLAYIYSTAFIDNPRRVYYFISQTLDKLEDFGTVIENSDVDDIRVLVDVETQETYFLYNREDICPKLKTLKNDDELSTTKRLFVLLLNTIRVAGISNELNMF